MPEIWAAAPPVMVGKPAGSPSCALTSLRCTYNTPLTIFPEGAVYEQAYNLISDGAAGCVVSREPGGFRMLAAHQTTNGAMVETSDDQVVGSYFSYTHGAIMRTLGRAGLTPGEIDWVVPQNTNVKAWQIMARLLGIDPARVYFPSMAEAAHVISGDNIINLQRLAGDGALQPGHKILLVMAGYGMNWQCTVLEAAEPGRSSRRAIRR